MYTFTFIASCRALFKTNRLIPVLFCNPQYILVILVPYLQVCVSHHRACREGCKRPGTSNCGNHAANTSLATSHLGKRGPDIVKTFWSWQVLTQVCNLALLGRRPQWDDVGQVRWDRGWMWRRRRRWGGALGWGGRAGGEGAGARLALNRAAKVGKG